MGMARQGQTGRVRSFGNGHAFAAAAQPNGTVQVREPARRQRALGKGVFPTQLALHRPPWMQNRCIGAFVKVQFPDGNGTSCVNYWKLTNWQWTHCETDNRPGAKSKPRDPSHAAARNELRHRID